MDEMGLSLEGRKFLEKRMKAHERIEKMSQLIDAIKAFSELAPKPEEEVKSIITGASTAKVNFIVDVVRAYRSEKPKQTVRDFFNERYADKAMVVIKPKDAIQEAIHGYRETTEHHVQE
jgi:hypothetical protein